MRERYERIEKQFWVRDEELGIELQGELDHLDRGTFPTGELRFETSRKKDKLHGSSIYYTKDGQILSTVWFYEGSKMGKARRYFPTGQLYSLERFIGDLPHLAQEFYYLDGSVKTLVYFDKGLLHGESKMFWPDGRLKRISYHLHGQKQDDQFFDEEGNLIGNS